MKRRGLFYYGNILLLILCFCTVLLVDMFVKYSSGDDMQLLTLAEKYSLWEFIKQCPGARISKKISLYLVMHMDINIWRIINAAVFTLFFGVVSKIVLQVKNIVDEKEKFYIRFILLISICFLHASIIGFAIFWVTGTQDYLWPLTFGIISLIPEIQYFYGKQISVWSFLGAAICALWGGMGQEQISFALICIAFMLIIVRRRYNIKQGDSERYCFLLFLIRIACFCVLMFSPMNRERMVNSPYYTGFDEMSALKHLFLTVQWELSAFANEMKLLFVAIWLNLAVLYYQEKSKNKFFIVIIMLVSTLPSFIGFIFLNDVGISTITNMGISVDAIVKATDNVVSFSTMSVMNWIAFVWWGVAALIVTPYLLKDEPACCFLYILGVILPLMMITSPSIYVSGGRVFFASGVLFSCVIAMLLAEWKIKKHFVIAFVISVLCGLYEIAMDVPYLIENLIEKL